MLVIPYVQDTSKQNRIVMKCGPITPVILLGECCVILAKFCKFVSQKCYIKLSLMRVCCFFFWNFKAPGRFRTNRRKNIKERKINISELVEQVLEEHLKPCGIECETTTNKHKKIEAYFKAVKDYCSSQLSKHVCKIWLRNLQGYVLQKLLALCKLLCFL